MLDGVNIGAILNEEGNIVQAVLLKCGGGPSGSSSSSTSSATATTNDDGNNENIIEQICVDTCPQRRMVEQILGGNGITFIGQYEDEGIVVVASKQQQQPADHTHVINPHRLQPPLHNMTICGDILLLKVRQEEEDIDPTKPFFQDYTKEDYATFASRTIDETAKEEQEEEEPLQEKEELSISTTSTEDCSSSYSSSSIEEGGEDEEEEEEQSEDGEEKDSSEETEEAHDDDDDDDYVEDVSELGMFNLVMGSFLRQYQENNGRGPSTEELLFMRQTLAEKMGIVLDSITTNTATATSNTDNSSVIITETKVSPSTASSNTRNGCSPPKKRVKFTIQE
jgi:hypothetical protein